ncbi:16S rRNA (guanine(966)-N(2))-methyltransferase RsmD [Xanthomonas phaseoli]|uniref:16S rRNA (Guanine(966)-N(2))-methyltransferase RsmD n=4 Tax=Xanthomonas TaxID=338 RepID=A0A8I2BVR9_XANMN|nr:16S rRNA (guanine(966)-N(2))-methyltransferase RsmD [Xanthomonas phaseoli]MBO9722506.1 16S rRNA (guanine(966)-N(2))-methyltransferase RsmD [Xanthomonas phaseoli pv. manihotis]MBO9757775.1 16S rRNA (guanine(966)-N(2))-methyltransferase RsmD [Xanthomonas phaseoli pv. manihotis]MBO9761699.1 16S rRNA (guanine(966)-N(2))-methyltransferase RsmD [Xanthomonas phaseoli pv. manihotis]MBO9764841.1 16S rRNA (guanine(966)-N(2))-methyltransferase RsmD [Xanthomonas phaseoli pv. manihotis]MBO9785982.1 16S 
MSHVANCAAAVLYPPAIDRCVAMSRPSRPAPRGTEGQVRIVGGRWRNTRLAVPGLPGLRPSSDRVRETVFNWLMPRLPGARVLDLFAGSGALGLEAVSRGAAHATLIERDPGLVQRLREHVARLDAATQVQVLQEDALRWLERAPAALADIVFVDPPFAADLWPAVLERLPAHVAADGWLYLEAPADAPLLPAGWHLHREGATREVRYALYRRAAATLKSDPTPVVSV